MAEKLDGLHDKLRAITSQTRMCRTGLFILPFIKSSYLYFQKILHVDWPFFILYEGEMPLFPNVVDLGSELADVALSPLCI